MNKIPQHSGMTLVELMISMTIGLFLIGATASVYLASKDTQRTTERVAQLQESGRLILHWIAEDIQMAGNMGNNNNPSFTDRRRGTPNQLGATSATGTAVQDCGDRWYIDMSSIFAVGNDTNPYSLTCLSTVNYLDQTDVIAVKRAAAGEIADGETSSAAHSNRTLIRSDMLRSEFFIGGTAEPTGFDPDTVTDRRWLAHVYFIEQDDENVPVLRRLNLGSGPNLFNRVVARGVQDLQIQYGVDTNGDGSPEQYIEPGNESPGDDIVAAKVWVLMRSEEREVGYDDSINTYTYAAKQYTPGDASSDNETEVSSNPTQYRRLLLSTTVTLRNDWN